MDFLLQINDIVSGPIKDLMVHFYTGQPEINLPQINMPAPPENVSVDFSPSIEKTEPSNFLNDLSLPDINVSAI